jgi:hypothetical protein
MKRVFLAAMLALLCCVGARADREVSRKEFVQQVYSSVVLLYSQDVSGGMTMHCTATAYRTKEHDGKKFTRFVSAAHCVKGDTDEEQSHQAFFITLDSEGAKTFIPAKLVRAGDKKKGDDFAIFEVEGDKFPVVQLGDNKKLQIGDEVVDVSSPFGLGKMYYQGYISNTHVDRPPVDAGEVEWNNVMIVSIGGGPGSSGSAIVSVEQHAIVGFLVGQISGGNIGFIVVQVDKFKAFEEAVDKGTYKKTPAKEDLLKGLFGGDFLEHLWHR